ncbi:MAG: hypothetical protein RI897_2611 [Verrucomicrobiota bacterium]
MGVEDGGRVAQGGGYFALVLPGGHEHGGCGVAENVLRPGGKPELGRHQAKGTSSRVAGDRQRGVQFLGIGEPLDRTRGAVDQPPPPDLGGGFGCEGGMGGMGAMEWACYGERGGGGSCVRASRPA